MPEPLLHDLVTVLRAPTAVLSAPSGQIRRSGAQGVYHDDRRALSQLELDVDGVDPVGVGHRAHGPGRELFHAVVPGVALSAPLQGPSVHVARERTARAGVVIDRMEVVNGSDRPLAVSVRLRAATDMAAMSAVKMGTPASLVPPTVDGHRVRWPADGAETSLDVDVPWTRSAREDDTVVLMWDVTVPPASRWRLVVTVSHHAERPAAFSARDDTWAVRLALPLGGPPEGSHRGRLLRRSADDADALALVDAVDPRAVFLAAGSPWYFALFGRDSLWAARLLAPFAPGLAVGTLRALARHQGTRTDARSEEQPGKIPHEVRGVGADLGGLVRLPPRYYGAIDATALWVCLLVEAWRAGLGEDSVRSLLPHLRAALTWMRDYGDADGDGFLEYTPGDGGGLVNQGWKDSHEGVRWADGRTAEAPLALCETQGYAFQAAAGGAALLEALGEPGSQGWRGWARALRDRFRAAFWLTDVEGRYPAIALDARKQPVTGAASNMGHLLGTGILDPDEAGAIAARLAAPDLTCGYGLRTLTAHSAAFNPYGYHLGSVWPHDTVIAVLGLAAEGHHEQARALAEQVVGVAECFGYRLPELYGGTDATSGEPVTAYPAACSPQAWSAAAGVAAVAFLSGWDHPMAHRPPPLAG